MTDSRSDFHLVVRQQAPISLDAELSCRGGELLALVGPSGSGKSTLLRMIAGLAKPATGRIECGPACWFDSERGIHLDPQQRHVGFVPQHYGLFPHLSAQENVEAGLAHLAPPERRQRALRWLAKVHLEALAGRRPQALSGGQQQRVALARALAREPSILLLDEPFASVDRPAREGLYLELAELKRELASPIVLVTHDLSEALMLGDRLALLDRGTTLQSGIPWQVVARPASEAAARLVGIRNLYDGQVQRYEADTGLAWVRTGGIEIAIKADVAVPVGSRVRWMIPNSAIRLPGIQRPASPSARNRCRMTIRSVLPMGETVHLVAGFHDLDAELHLQAPAHLAHALQLAPGAPIEVTLREERLHLVPAASPDP